MKEIDGLEEPCINVFSTLVSFYYQPVFSTVGDEISSKKPYLKFFFSVVSRFRQSRLFNYFLLVFIVIFYQNINQPNSTRAVFQVAPSKNNRRVFERLNIILKSSGISCIDLNGKPYPIFGRLRIVFASTSLFKMAKLLNKYQEKNSFIHTQKAIGAASVIMYMRSFKARRPKLVCVANDHAPMPLAAASVARLLKIPTCYVQHAPVTVYFPPLNFDLALLFDRMSYDNYKKIGQERNQPIKGRVIFFAPFDRDFCWPRLHSEKVSVGICLSFLTDNTELRQLMDLLKINTVVSSIVVRQHPRSKADYSKILDHPKVTLQGQNETLDSFINTVSLALVPSSGVAIELMHSGCPTFYVPGLDRLSDDYYGFVRQGVLPLFDVKYLEDKGKVAEFYDEQWLEKFSLHDDTVRHSRQQSNTDVVNEFSRLLNDCIK